MKTCPRCHVEKPNKDFCRASRFQDGLAFYCRECTSKARKEKYYSNLEESREKKNEEQKRRRRENPERFREYDRASYQKNREKEIERGKVYRDKNRAIINKKQIIKARKSGKPARPGYIYIVRFPYQIEGKNFYKIGQSINPFRRQERLSSTSPVPVILEILIKTDDMSMLESELHHKFSKSRSNKEWFFLSDNDIDTIISENKCMFPPFS